MRHEASKQFWQVFLPLRPLVALVGGAVAMLGCEDDGKEPVSQLILSASAQHDYIGTYRQDQGHKAFAMSPDGAFAAAHTFPTADLAVAAALINCNARVQFGQLECLVYDINGVIVVQGPTRLRRK